MEWSCINKPHSRRWELIAVTHTRFLGTKNREEARKPVVQAVARPGTRPTESGFTLVELLVVIGILLTLAAIALSYMWRARMRANEASAVASLRVIHGAEQLYSLNYNLGVSETLAQLGPPAGGVHSANAADLIPSALASGQKSGYLFVYRPVGTIPAGVAKGWAKGKGFKKIRIVVYSVTAEPIQVGGTGIHYYYVDESGILRIAAGKKANANSAPI